MRITPPTIPHHVARAYGVKPAAASPVRAPETAARVAPAGDDSPAALRKLVAGGVPGGIDFSGREPAPGAPSHHLYRHPADRNAAATALTAGRTLDVEG
jgi:hypothetical protein